jgi:hypothetical protein
MTKTPEQIKKEARALRNKKIATPAYIGDDPFSSKKGSVKTTSQTTQKAPRKPSV